MRLPPFETSRGTSLSADDAIRIPALLGGDWVMKKQKSTRETNPNALRPTMFRRVDRRIGSTGELALPCAPSLLDEYMRRLASLWELLGKPFTEEELSRLREIVERYLNESFKASPYTQLFIRYETKPPPHPGIAYRVWTHVSTIADEYEKWTKTREPPLFGKHADAKVLKIAEELGPAAEVPVLDIGAGTGRNSLPLAKRGHPTDALELAPALAAALREAAEKDKLPVKVVEGDVLDPKVELPRAHYRLIILAEVIASHFQRVDQVRTLGARVAELLAPGGVLLFNAFLSSDGYKPDPLARELSHVFWSNMFTRHEMKTAFDGLPFIALTDESAYEYERANLPPDAWPPTGWYPGWSQGLDLFAVPGGKAPMELRWLTYRRKEEGDGSPEA